MGYRVGILSSDGDGKAKRDGSSNPKHGSSGGESDHWVSGEDGDGELVNDGIGEELDGSSKLKKLSHGSFSVWQGAVKSESSHVSCCSGDSERISVDESEISNGVGKWLLHEDMLWISN